MKKKLLGLAIASVLFSSPVLAAPVYRVDAEVAQGNVGNGLSVVLAPAQVVSINFSKMGEKIASITPGDRSRFVFNATGSVVHLKRIKPLNFEGEYSGGGDTTLIITTIGASGQKVYPVTVKFSDRRPGYSVVEISPDEGSEPIPAKTPRNKIPLTTVQVPIAPSIPVEVSELPIEDPVKVLTPRNSTEIRLTPPQVVEASKPEPKAKAKKVVKADLKPDSEKTLKSKVVAPASPTLAEVPKPEAKAIEIEIEIVEAEKTVKSKLEPAPQKEAKATASLAATASPRSLAETGTPPKKLTNHQKANAIVQGMMRAKTSYSEYRRAQDAIWLLRKGKSLPEAARRSGVSVARLQKFIELGSKKDA